MGSILNRHGGGSGTGNKMRSPGSSSNGGTAGNQVESLAGTGAGLGKSGGSSGGKLGSTGGGTTGGGIQQGSGLKKGAVNSGVGGVVGTGKGFTGKGTATVGGIDQAGNQAFNQLPASAQSWVQTQAGALASTKHFNQKQHQQLLHQAASAFPQVDPNLVVAMIRFRALQASSGGSIHSLYAKPGGPTAFQTQLIRGGQP